MAHTKEVKRECPRCGTEFSSSSCPSCDWSAPEEKGSVSHYCNKCNAKTEIKYHGEYLCIVCYSNEYSKSENYFRDKALDGTLATSDQISRFLIKQGSKSAYWEHATLEQQQAAKDYYKKHKEDFI